MPLRARAASLLDSVGSLASGVLGGSSSILHRGGGVGGGGGGFGGGAHGDAGSSHGTGSGVSNGRIASFISRDKSPDKKRSALLVAGLAGLGRISESQANTINRRNGLGLGRTTNWSRMIDAAAGRGQPATVLVLTGTGFQASDWNRLSAAHLYHAIAALKRTGQDYSARMIAAEALSRT